MRGGTWRCWHRWRIDVVRGVWRYRECRRCTRRIATRMYRNLAGPVNMRWVETGEWTPPPTPPSTTTAFDKGTPNSGQDASHADEPGGLRLAGPSNTVVEAPDVLSAEDGEVVFVRRDVAETVTAARAYALEHEGTNLSHMEVDEVEMLAVPEHFTAIRGELGYEWSVVEPGTSGAVAFWRFRL